ncbi:uncharacterized protein LOC142336222 [Convolutriloba macropyga]|uniref:uncharacterized protein LOC142336222 n=1 Tax=Convolutriloba macropyga TaxID=536237 RepID=UPI003F51ED6A
MKVTNPEDAFPHHLHLCNKQRLQDLVTQIQTQQNQQPQTTTTPTTTKTTATTLQPVQIVREKLETEGSQEISTTQPTISDKEISEQTEQKLSSAITDKNLSSLELKVRELWEHYLKEVDSWSALQEEKSKQISKLELQCQKQAEIIEENKSSLASEQLKRHKSEHLLKIIAETNPELSRIAPLQAGKLSNKQNEADNPDYQQKNESETELITHNDDEVAESEKVDQNEMKVKINQLTSQLEIEQDKIVKLQEIVADYHKEKREQKSRESLLEQRSQVGPRSLASRHSSAPLVKTLGESDDFFEEMFSEPKFLTLSSQMLLSNGFVTSSIGSIRLENVSQNGNFITIRNASVENDEELGLCILQQKLKGKTIASFRFPQRAKLRAGSKVNIWATSTSEARHLPPYDYIWKDQYKCVYGLECITVLCRPNGQAIAWYCGQHHYDGNLVEMNDLEMMRRRSRLIPMVETQIGEEVNKKGESIRREKTDTRLGTSEVRKHPHGFHFHMKEHPSSDTFREKSGGNDQTSLMRQTRLARTPDIVPELYAGGARTGMRALYRAWGGSANLVPVKSSAGMIRKMSAPQAA